MVTKLFEQSITHYINKSRLINLMISLLTLIILIPFYQLYVNTNIL